MRPRLRFLILLLLITSATAQICNAQSTVSDSGLRPVALINVVSLLTSSLGKQSPLYNGREYYPYDPVIKGDAYFLEARAFTPGSVVYDGAVYNGVPILYDLYLDDVVTLWFDQFSTFSLVKQKVQRFDYLGHHFVNIDSDTIPVNTSGIKSGYYDQLYKGKVEVLVKRSKSIQTTSTTTSPVEYYFSPQTRYFIRKNGTYYSVNTERALLRALQDRKKEVEQYIKKQGIEFHKNPEESLVEIASYYEHLTN